jgi:uncharacterized phage infection (PIP) family protein YhgE
MRKSVGCFLSVLLVAITSLACVSRGTYQEAVQARDQLNQQLDTAARDLSATNAELTSARKELDSVQSSLTATQAELAAANSRATTSQTDLAKSQADLRSLQQAYDVFNAQVKEAQKYWNVVDSLLVLLPALSTGFNLQTAGALGRVVGSVRDTGNEQLVAAWEKVTAAINTSGQDAALLDFLAVLGQRLAETRPQTR